MKPFLRVFPMVLLPVAVLAGCATIPSEVSQAKEVAPEPLKLSIGYDAAFLRVDLKRATHLEQRFVMEPDSSGVMKLRPEPVYVKNPYSLLLASFGNGLIVDRNGNLGIDLLRLYHLNGAKGFHVVERFVGPLEGGRSVVKSGARLTRKGIGLTVEHLSAITDGNIIHLSGEAFFPHMRIVRGKSTLSLQPAGRPTSRTTTIRQPTPHEVVFPEIGGKMIFRQLGTNQIRSSEGLDITRAGNHLEIVLHAPGGVAASFVYSKTQNGCVVTSSDGYPTIRITRLGDKIYVTSDHFLAATATIDSETR